LVLVLIWFLVLFALPKSFLARLFASIGEWQRETRDDSLGPKHIGWYIVQGIGQRTRVRLIL